MFKLLKRGFGWLNYQPTNKMALRFPKKHIGEKKWLDRSAKEPIEIIEHLS